MIRHRAVAAPSVAADVVREHLAQEIVFHDPQEGTGAPEASEPRHRVGTRPAGHLDRRAHRVVEALGFLLGLDEAHRALHHVVPDQEFVVGLRDHIDDRAADTDDVEIRAPHGDAH
jgi:hypothetical protein